MAVAKAAETEEVMVVVMAVAMVVEMAKAVAKAAGLAVDSEVGSAEAMVAESGVVMVEGYSRMD